MFKKMSKLDSVSENKIEEVNENKIEEVIENKISKENILVIKNLFEIVSNRGVFKIHEFVLIGNFYDKFIKQEDLTKEDFKSIKNILDLCATRGAFKIEEFDTIFKLNTLIDENISE